MLIIIILFIFALMFSAKSKSEGFETYGNFPRASLYDYNRPYYYRLPHNKKFTYLDRVWKDPLQQPSFDSKFHTFAY
jgi:hypothetical protein